MNFSKHFCYICITSLKLGHLKYPTKYSIYLATPDIKKFVLPKEWGFFLFLHFYFNKIIILMDLVTEAINFTLNTLYHGIKVIDHYTV